MNTGDTAWVLASASLVLLMTPGLAFFYGGMVRSKSALNMIVMSFTAMAVVGVVWVVVGYSLAFGPHNMAGGLFADPFDAFGLHGVIDTTDPASATQVNPLAPTIPAGVFAGFQMTFAIITAALISGAIADRTKFSTWIVFCGIWIVGVYAPMAHMVWGGGLLGADGLFGNWFRGVAPMDFAGGTVVHINAGMAGLVLALIVGKRHGFGRIKMGPHNLPLVMLGAGILWFGWFGFNAGSALAANGSAGLAWINTCAAPCAAILGWLFVERLRDGKATSLGVASGAVAGLVGITPAAGLVSPLGAVALGTVAGVVCALAIGLKFRLGFDDSLDVVGVHLIGGLVGTVLVGLLSTTTGLLYGHGPGQLIVQVCVAAATIIFSGVLTAIIGLVLKWLMGWRVPADHEHQGVDVALHAETAYAFDDSIPAALLRARARHGGVPANDAESDFFPEGVDATAKRLTK